MGIGTLCSHEYFETEMNYNINPFQQLYFADDLPSKQDFVELFSEVPLQAAINPIFQGGNVVLLGTQGCGKSMILSLLRPETRIAYAKAGKEFPVAENLRSFISAGVNITRSGIHELVQVTLNRGDDADMRELPLYFADFFNYWVMDDLLKSVTTIGSHPEVFGTKVDLSEMPAFVKLIVTQDCWFGALKDVKSLIELQERIASRIGIYRRWINGNLPETNPALYIQQSKTNIGEPIARTADCLRESGVTADKVPILIRVDQIEELHRAFTDRQRHLLFAFRKIINRVFAGRDARVHYRAGSRRYGWNNPDFLTVWGSEARLEKRRDYLLIDMDNELFARGEAKNTIFERFATDAFKKRVQYYYETKEVSDDLAKTVFGKNPVAQDRLESLNNQPEDKQIDRALGLDLASDGVNWTKEWRVFLRQLYRSGHKGMLDAVLAAAWGRQTGGGQIKMQHRESSPPTNAPWRERKWWRKERLDQAVLQLLTRNQQRFVWWGFNDVISLSGGNITVFLHICHRIWDGFLKKQSNLPSKDQVDLMRGETIEPAIQSTGILVASNEWFKKLPEEPGGDARQRFIEELGKRLNSAMMNDLPMRYPGGNGISVTESEFESNEQQAADLRRFIRESVGFGALWETLHSSKSKAGGRRIKFYLNPILCPRFQLPEAKTKEPYYWKIAEMVALAKKANVTLSRARAGQTKDAEGKYLFPEYNTQKS
jgi:hypothetical protein